MTLRQVKLTINNNTSYLLWKNFGTFVMQVKACMIKKTRENEIMREKEMERGRRKERKTFHKNNRYWFISVLDIVG